MKPTRLLRALSIAAVALLLQGAKPKPLTQATITNTSASVLTNGATPSGQLQVRWSESLPTAGVTMINYEIAGTVTLTDACLVGGVLTPISCTLGGGTPSSSTVLSGGCDFTTTPNGALLFFTLTGISPTKTTVSNTVDVPVPDSGTLANVCTGAGGTLVLYQIIYSGPVTISDLDHPSSTSTNITVGSGTFQGTLCRQAALSGCPVAQ